MSIEYSPADRLNHGRREFLRDAFCGFGSLALSSMLQQDNVIASPQTAATSSNSGAFDPLAARPAHFPARARSVIFLFMGGGPSHLETFDPKPLLNKLSGQKRPAEFGEAKYQLIKADAKLLGSARKFSQHGESGIEVSDLFPHLAKSIDDIAVVRSCYGDRVVHSAAQYELFNGRLVPGFPSMGSWVVYGLGSDSRSLPSYVVLPDPGGALEAGQPMYSSGFLPAVYQPTMFRNGPHPVRNLSLPPGVTLDQRQETLRLVRQLNQSLEPQDDQFVARLRSYDLAFRMQTEGPDVFDLSRETRETQELYGIGTEPTDDYGRRCLLARRLVEKGVRFTVVVSGGGSGDTQWDAHNNIEENHQRMARRTDRPIAALLLDLKRRGLLDETLILWGGEFGRSPEAQGGKGRDHHNLGFTMWFAGGGVRGGQVIGATDAIGLRAVEQPCHFRDIHTTLLHLLGLDQETLSYPHLGRRERLTLVHGTVIKQLIS